MHHNHKTRHEIYKIQPEKKWRMCLSVSGKQVTNVQLKPEWMLKFFKRELLIMILEIKKKQQKKLKKISETKRTQTFLEIWLTISCFLGLI